MVSRPTRDRPSREPIGIGDALRNERESRGLTLNEVAQETRIRAPFLLALEEEDFTDLPAPIYARAFLRTYAGFLGLDVDEMLDLLDRHRRLQSEAELVPATHAVNSDSGFSRLLVPVSIAVFLFGLAYFLFSQYSAFVASQETVQLSLPTSIPAVAAIAPIEPSATKTATATATQPPPTATATYTLTPMPTPMASKTAAPAATAIATPRPAAPTATAPVPTRTVSPQVSASPTGALTPTTPSPPSPSAQPATPTQPPAATPTNAPPVLTVVSPPTTPSATPPPSPTAKLAIVDVAFSGDCWIVAEVDDQVILNGVTQRAGSKLTWTGRKFVVKFGNAGVVDLLLNGKPTAKLGAIGEVVTWNWTAP